MRQRDRHTTTCLRTGATVHNTTGLLGSFLVSRDTTLALITLLMRRIPAPPPLRICALHIVVGGLSIIVSRCHAQLAIEKPTWPPLKPWTGSGANSLKKQCFESRLQHHQRFSSPCTVKSKLMTQVPFWTHPPRIAHVSLRHNIRTLLNVVITTEAGCWHSKQPELI